jgi:5-methylcytosine-specific restriction enzyme subunit McrC
MQDYSVREYAFISVLYEGCPESSLDHAYISASAFEYLCGLAASFSKNGAKIFEIAGRKKLKLDQYVGVIETPCGIRIEILPKHVEFKNEGENDEEYQYKVIQKRT